MINHFALNLRRLMAVVLLGSMPVVAHAQSAPAPAPVTNGFPTWSEFPPPPENVPTAAEIKGRVLDIQGIGGALQRTVDAIVWDLDPAARITTAANARIDPLLGAPAKPVDPVELEAFASKLRARATPPPVEK
ncbi:hypothetical protein PQU92_00660 [Asticcacaulis sp. BYS171W]|uniref:Uncharacterized protein n=1 Tax=Asticcacaulis aquaticus TaxID=2984212 RepID=A0ABT5HP74_9CAUL|nr:hypothetical protein [Asticcacaulis aquaticus]MDC7681772.1 hypothetical protein [Asticcacaulis aquaticus]